MKPVGFRAALLGVNALEPQADQPECAAGVEAAFRSLLTTDRAVSRSQLDWYPTLADVAPSADLGFTVGAWTRHAEGNLERGNYLGVWRRDDACRWQMTVDAGIVGKSDAADQARPPPEQMAYHADATPPIVLVAEDAVARAVEGFGLACEEDGLAAALRTYARNGDFLLLHDQFPAMGLAMADRMLTRSGASGAWHEEASGRSADSSLVYRTGTLSKRHGGSRRSVQIWQFDPKVANWGVRVLMVGSEAVLSK